MLQDLAALTPPAIVCVAFLVGAGALLRRELAPRRRGGGAARRDGAGLDGRDPDARSGLVAPQGQEDGRELGGTSRS
jgi:hypothetical protein